MVWWASWNLQGAILILIAAIVLVKRWGLKCHIAVRELCDELDLLGECKIAFVRLSPFLPFAGHMEGALSKSRSNR